jgi:AraC family transcriptional regulator
VNRHTSPDASNYREPAALSYGQFYGVLEQPHELSRFSIALVAADEVSVKRKKHSHESAHIIFTLNGNYLSSGPRPDHLVPLRSSIFVPAGTTHEDHFLTPDTLTFNVSVSAAQIEQARDYVRLPDVQSDFRHGEVGFLTSRLEAECRCWRDTSVLTAEGLCLELLAAIAQRQQTSEQRPPRWLRTVRELLCDRSREAVSLSELAAAVKVHPIHLSRTFRKFFHCTPGEYLRACRLENAASLLRSSHTPIAQIATEAGFSDQSQLSKAFRRKFCVSPAEFRRGNS